MYSRYILCTLREVRVHPPHSRCLSKSTLINTPSGKTSNETPSKDFPPEVDQYCVPITPTWSVHQLINSYPSPELSDASLTRLYALAALVPPEPGTSHFTKVKREMGDLVRLIEAVRMAPLAGRVYSSAWSIGAAAQDGPPPAADLQGRRESSGTLPPSGRELLKHAKRANDGYYVVDSSRPRI
ncbi:hypothetical protein BU17DRAFT_36905 [Hysterangium stoloniferum]|nr:hypothetical protein BU17DRAFT_36905 [Hysterangium stoloniferum]